MRKNKNKFIKNQSAGNLYEQHCNYLDFGNMHTCLYGTDIFQYAGTPLPAALLDVWENSVRETHLFLSDEEICKIKEYVPKAFAACST